LTKNLIKNQTFEKRIENVRYIGMSGNLIDDVIYEIGAWEPSILFFLRDTLQRTNKDQGIFLDIGANTGQHSLYMAQYAKTVYAIEPYPPVLKRFNEMISLNGFENIKVYPVGFSNREDSLPYYKPSDDNLGHGGFDPTFTKGAGKSIELPLVIGDNYLESHGINQIDLIKIDIEGYERYALLGLNNTLKKNRPIVVMELNATEGGFKTKAQLIGTFPENYNFFYIEGNYMNENKNESYWFINIGPYRYSWGPGFKYQLEPFDFSFNKQANLAAIPNEKLELIMAEE
jgi:FkbM family methyltransferase